MNLKFARLCGCFKLRLEFGIGILEEIDVPGDHLVFVGA